MHILVKSVDNGELELHVECRELNYGGDGPQFWVRYVMGDDWLGQKFLCTVQASPVAVAVAHLSAVELNGREPSLVVTYQTQCDAEAFANWLEQASAMVENGFRTMRG